jgi:hypothetical protein
MAIEIQGTVVIDDNRRLTNITNLKTVSGNSILGSGNIAFSGQESFNSLLYSRGQLLHTLNNPNSYSTFTEDYFGFSVSVSGNYAIVGAYQEDEPNRTDAGKAYIYDVSTGALLHTLYDPNAYSSLSNQDYFGYSVAISGNRAIVGAYAEDEIGQAGSGKAYIFDVVTGNLLQTLNNPNAYSTAEFDRFGAQVAISGNLALVSAHTEDDEDGENSGKVYVFDVSSGALIHTLDNPNVYSTGTNDLFGLAIDISGNYAIVGTYQEDALFDFSSGRAYIFNVLSGELLHILDNPNYFSLTSTDYFGYSVAISGNRAIVGALWEDESLTDSGTDSGKAYIYDVETGTLLHVLTNPNIYSTPKEDYFGYSVAISEKYAVVGARLEDNLDHIQTGMAYIFDVSTGAFLEEIYNPHEFGSSSGDVFGSSLSMSDDYIIVGAHLEDDLSGQQDSGRAYIFAATNILDAVKLNEIKFSNETTSSSLQKSLEVAHTSGSLVHTLTNPNAYSTSADDQFGQRIAISGNRAIVGAHQEDDATGSSSGKAYIFDVTSGNLLHTLNNPNVYSTGTNDFFGYSVDISGDRAIVGAYQEDSSGTVGPDSGKAYIFDVITGTLLHTLSNPDAYSWAEADWFGWSVAISGNRCIVGAPSEDESGIQSQGKAYIFDVETGALLHVINNANAYVSGSGGDYFGFSVSISGNRAIVGAVYEDDAQGLTSGKAYIYNVSSGIRLHTLNNPSNYSNSANDEFGYSVDISGNYAIVGARLEDENGQADSGKAYIFDASTGSLVHVLSNPNAYASASSDTFGWYVGISRDRAIVGAPEEDDASGSSSGKAYIFDVLTGNLLNVLSNPNIYSTGAGDIFGQEVAISENYAIVSAKSEDRQNNSNSGAAYIFAARELTYLDKLYTLVS